MERARIFVLCVCLGVFLLDSYKATTTTMCSSCSNISDTTESANNTQPSETAGPAETTPQFNHSAGPTISSSHSTEGPPPASSIFPSGQTVTSKATGTSTVWQQTGRDNSAPQAASTTASTPSGSSPCTPGSCGSMLLCAVCVLLLSCVA